MHPVMRGKVRQEGYAVLAQFWARDTVGNLLAKCVSGPTLHFFGSYLIIFKNKLEKLKISFEPVKMHEIRVVIELTLFLISYVIQLIILLALMRLPH